MLVFVLDYGKIGGTIAIRVALETTPKHRSQPPPLIVFQPPFDPGDFPNA